MDIASITFICFGVISFCYIAPQTFFQPDVCTRLIQGVLREFSDFPGVSTYIKKRMHDEVLNLSIISRDTIFYSLPHMFSKSGKLPKMLAAFKDVIISIITGMKAKAYQQITTQNDFYLDPP